MTVTESNDLSGPPPSSPLSLNYSITDSAGNQLSESGLDVSLVGSNPNFTISPASVSAASPNALVDGLLVLSVVLHDAAGNPSTALNASIVLGAWFGFCGWCLVCGMCAVRALTAFNASLADRVSPSFDAYFLNSLGAYLNSAFVLSNSSASFTVNVTGANDLSSAVETSPLSVVAYAIYDGSGEALNFSGSLDIGGTSLDVHPKTLLGEGLSDGVLTLSVTVSDAAGNTETTLSSADTLILGQFFVVGGTMCHVIVFVRYTVTLGYRRV